MSFVVDVRKFIAEIRKRPALWDSRNIDYKARHSQAVLWKEVSTICGVDVDQCKRKWKNLRDAYRAELKRSERRGEGDKLSANASITVYKSRWAYFDAMGFVRFTQRHSTADVFAEEDFPALTFHDKNSDDNDNYFYGLEDNFHSSTNVKSDQEHAENKRRHLEDDEKNMEDDDEANDLLFEEFQNIATPQAARRLSATLSMVNTEEHKSHLAQQQQHDNGDASPTPSSCKCSKRTDEQVHFLEDLGREEQKLIISTKQDITRSNQLDHIGDSDYNFLVSFLPQMKKMNELQNLQFRAEMCGTVLKILAPSVVTQQAQVSADNVTSTPDVTLQTENDLRAGPFTDFNNMN